MINAAEYVKAETEAAMTAISMSVLSYSDIGETDTVATLMEMASNLSSTALKLVLGEATQDEHELWEAIIQDIREGL